MNKKAINEWIPDAYDVLSQANIAINGRVKKGYRSQISSFGSIITMGSLKSAVAIFLSSSQSELDRTKLMDAVWRLLEKRSLVGVEFESLWDYIEKTDNAQARVNILNATVALKLAMNLYTLIS